MAAKYYPNHRKELEQSMYILIFMTKWSLPKDIISHGYATIGILWLTLRIRILYVLISWSPTVLCFVNFASATNNNNIHYWGEKMKKNGEDSDWKKGT